MGEEGEGCRRRDVGRRKVEKEEVSEERVGRQITILITKRENLSSNYND
jgi:hypothetical protein